MSNIRDGDKVLATAIVGTPESGGEGTKVVFLVQRPAIFGSRFIYLVEENTYKSHRSKIFDNEQRKRDSLRAYNRALKTSALILPAPPFSSPELVHAFKPVWYETAKDSRGGDVLMKESDQCVVCNNPRDHQTHTNRKNFDVPKDEEESEI